MELENIIKTSEDVLKDGYSIKNNIIKEFDINIIGHFGNCVCLEICCRNVHPMSGYNNTSNIGYILKSLIKLLDIEKEDGLRFSNIKNIPCRIVWKGNQSIGIGSFMEDKFVYIEDLGKLGIKAERV